MKRRAPQGFALFDAIVATALLSVLLGVSVVTLASMAQGRRATENRAIALELAASAIERASRLPWDRITVESLDQITGQSRIGAVLPGASMKWTVVPTSDDLPAKQIRVEIVMTKNSAHTAPVRLTCWAYSDPKRAP